jgi:hypothetical protein
MKLCIQLLLCLIAASAVNSFAPNASINRSRSHGALKATVDEAVALYQKIYPKKGPRKQSPLVSLGMPVAPTSKFQTPKAGSDMGKSFSDRDEKDLKAGFKELAKAYGEANALQMVKDLPIVLAFNRNNFGPSLKELAKTFGDEEAKAMVQRNPGLLVIKPTGAGGADSVDDTAMKFSYVVAATRPAGPFLLYGTLSLLFEPVFEAVSGIPLKENLLAIVGF